MFYSRIFLFLIVSVLGWTKTYNVVTATPNTNTQTTPNSRTIYSLNMNLNDNNQAFLVANLVGTDIYPYSAQVLKSSNGAASWTAFHELGYSVTPIISSPVAINNQGNGIIAYTSCLYEETSLCISTMEASGGGSFVEIDRTSDGTFSSLYVSMSDDSQKAIVSWILTENDTSTLYRSCGHMQEILPRRYRWVWEDKQEILSGNIGSAQCALNNNDLAFVAFIQDNCLYSMKSIDAGQSWGSPTAISLEGVAACPLIMMNNNDAVALIFTRANGPLTAVASSAYINGAWQSVNIISNPDETVDQFMAYMNHQNQVLVAYIYCNACVACINSLDGGMSFFAPQILYQGTAINNLCVDLNNVNAQGNALGVVSFCCVASGSVMASYTLNAGMTYARPAAMASNVNVNGDLALNNDGNIVMAVVNSTASALRDAVTTATASLFSIDVNSQQTKLLLQRDNVTKLQGTKIDYATRYNVYSGSGNLLFSDNTLSADLHAQIADNQNYTITWVDALGNESLPIPISYP